MSCDGTDLEVAGECSYTKSIGTTYTTETSEHMSISSEIYSEIQAGMFGIMSTLGASTSTGYDWTEVSSETMAEEESFDVVGVVPPGQILNVEQVVGYCDGNTAKTEVFRLSHTDGEGNVVDVRYERVLKDGTTVVLPKKE